MDLLQILLALTEKVLFIEIIQPQSLELLKFIVLTRNYLGIIKSLICPFTSRALQFALFWLITYSLCILLRTRTNLLIRAHILLVCLHLLSGLKLCSQVKFILIAIRAQIHSLVLILLWIRKIRHDFQKLT